MVRTVDSRNLSPIELYRGLTGERPGTFLLESAEQGVWSRYSFIGVASMAMLTEVDGHAHWVGEPPVGVPLDGDPLVVLEETVEFLHTTPFADLPPLTGGMVGMIGYDAVRRLERIPEIAVDDLHLPELAMLVATDLAVLDHETGSIVLIANAVNRDGTDEHVEQAWADSIARLDAMQATVESLAPTPQTHSSAAGEPDLSHVKSNTTEQAYQDAVVQAKSEIAAGEAFQIVVSQRFSLPCTGSALAVYEELRRSNPSPYMYLM
ncbi:MAG: anthranilate synthase component I, partial [Actinobacteria bacterium]|nr:anthranilate synthase component I [Actinomycetota bacterium]